MNAPTVIIRDHWVAALKYRAIGRTAADLRAQAADPIMMEGLALLHGVTQEQERARVLAVAGAIDDLAEQGLTEEKCYFLAGLDRKYGPYPGTFPGDDLAPAPPAEQAAR